MENTLEQKQAIGRRGSDLFVSASAGSGKTYVMISRIIALILEGECEVNEILALTFTRAAANEMKEKLRRAITQKQVGATAEERAYLTRQLRLLPLTTVGTIHSFCSALLKSYFFEAGVDPTFEMLAEEETEGLKQEAIEGVIEGEYERGDADFMLVSAAFSGNRKDDKLIETVKAIAEFAESERDGEAFYNQCLSAHSEEAFFRVEQALKTRLTATLNELYETTQPLCDEGSAKGYNKKQVEYLKTIAEILRQCQAEKDFYACANQFSGAKLTRKPSGNKKVEDPAEEEWCSSFDSAVAKFKAKQVEFLKITTKERATRANELAEKTVKVLVRLAKAYQEEYARKKEREGKLDFSDLERKTLALLQNESVREAVKKRYRYVFVDEYQDVNGVQEAIFNLLTDENLFLVGDVKQSIYAFRGCNPELFNRKIQSAQNTPKHIALKRNFRSAKGVLDGVNQVFNRIMTEETVGQNYKEEALEFGEGYPDGEGIVAFCDYGKAEKGALPTGVYSVKRASAQTVWNESEEVTALCNLVENLVGKQEIAVDEKGTTRKITYGDIAILYRGKSAAAGVAEGLKRRDIPITMEKREIPLTASPEVNLLLSALRLATGSREDIPFVNVLLSPMGNMDESELRAVRKYQKRMEKEASSFYHAAELFVNCGDSLPLWEGGIQAKLKKSFTLIEELTQKAEFLSASELMEELCVTYSLRAHAYAKPMGKRRVNMMNRLIAEGFGSDGVGMFANAFLHRVDMAGEKLAYGEMESGNTVKMMTMHASKGLEFPVVILCGLHGSLSNKDVSGLVFLDRELGILPCGFDDATHQKFETLHRILFRGAFRKNRAKEEMRLLYVAMTRAKNRLYLMRNSESEPEERAVTEISNYMQWLWKENFPTFTAESVEGERVAPERRSILLSGGEDFATAIENARAFIYPYPKAVAFPEKETVTGILARSKTGEKVTKELAKSKERESRLLGNAETRKERGIRIHAFMEKCDLAKTEESAVLAEMRAFVERGELIEEDLASAPAISRILSSPVMEEVRKGQIFREREFTMLHTVDGEDGAVVQGVIDLLSVAEDGIIIVDYKNSTLADEELVATYKQQLDLYAEAAFRFYGIKIKKKVIINLTNESVLTV